MNWKSVLLESFIRGIGKTSAALVVCGVLGGAWTLYSSFSFSTDNDDIRNSNETNDENNYENNNNHDDDDDDDEETYNTKYISKNKENKFKSIFDNL